MASLEWEVHTASTVAPAAFPPIIPEGASSTTKPVLADQSRFDGFWEHGSLTSGRVHTALESAGNVRIGPRFAMRDVVSHDPRPLSINASYVGSCQLETSLTCVTCHGMHWSIQW